MSDNFLPMGGGETISHAKLFAVVILGIGGLIAVRIFVPHKRSRDSSSERRQDGPIVR